MALDLKGQAFLDDKPFNATVARMKRTVKGASAGMQAGGGGGFQGMLGMAGRGAGAAGMTVAVIAGAIAAAVKWAQASIQVGSALKDEADASGIATEKHQRYVAIAREHGKSSDVITAAMGRVRDAQGQVTGGNKQMTDAFQRLGISAQDVASLAPDALFNRVAKAFTEANGSAKAYSATADILGTKAMPNLVAILKDVGGGIDTAGDKTKILSEQSVEALDRMGDAWDRFKSNVKVSLAQAFVSTVDFFRSSESLQEESNANQKRIQERKQAESLARQANIDQLRTKQDEDKAKAAAKIKDDLAAIADRARPGAIIGDSISKVGGMIGGSASPEIRLAEKQLTIADEQRKYLAKIEANTKNKQAAVTSE